MACSLSLPSCTKEKKAMWGHSKKVADYNPKRGPLPEPDPAGTLI